MENKIANIISYIFHPLLMPSYALLMLFQFNWGYSFQLTQFGERLLFLFIFCGTFVIPVLTLLLLKRFGVIKDLYIKSRKERSLPFIIIGAFFYGLFIILNRIELPPIFYLISMGMAIIVLFAMVVNLFWKISIHTLGVGAISGTFFGIAAVFHFNIFPLIATLILISGVVGWARLRLKSHTPAQIYAGFAAGFSIMISIFVFI